MPRKRSRRVLPSGRLSAEKGVAAAIDIAQTAIGNGILVAGGINDTVERNLVYDNKHKVYGANANIKATVFENSILIPVDVGVFLASGNDNLVQNNQIWGNDRYGVWLAASLKFLVPFSLLTALGERFGWHPTVFASAVPLRMVIDAAAPLVAAPATAAAHQSLSSPLAAVGSTLPVLLVAAWVLGAATLVVTWIVRWRRVASLVRSAASVEFRVPVYSRRLFGVNPEHELAPFFDAGEVFHRIDDSPVSDLHVAYGMGFRFVVRPQVVAYVDIGFGFEGSAVFSGVSYPF